VVVSSGGARPSPALWARGLHELGLVGSLLGVDLVHQVSLTQVLTTVHLNLGEQWVHTRINTLKHRETRDKDTCTCTCTCTGTCILALYMYIQISYMMKKT